MKGSRTPLKENTMGLHDEWSFRIMAVIQKSTSVFNNPLWHDGEIRN